MLWSLAQKKLSLFTGYYKKTIITFDATSVVDYFVNIQFIKDDFSRKAK